MCGSLASRRGTGNVERIRQTTESCLGRMVEARCRTPCLSLWAINSAGQSTRLITGVSQVRVLDGPPWGCDGIGRHWGLKIPCFMRAGSNPAIPTSLLHWPNWIRHLTFNQGVASSSLAWGTIKKQRSTYGTYFISILRKR